MFKVQSGHMLESVVNAELSVELEFIFVQTHKVETFYHDNDLILTPIISPQSG
jgi:hypothetical protein